MEQQNEKIIEKINRTMKLGKEKLKGDKSRYPFYLMLLFLLVVIFITVTFSSR